MSTAYLNHESCKLHDVGSGHPESPARMDAVEKGMSAAGLDKKVTHLPVSPAPLSAIKRVHNPDYVDEIVASSPKSGLHRLDGDTAMNPHSLDAVLNSSGAVMGAADAVLAGKVSNAFCAVRPPGHHAERWRAMGFCLFDGVAVGAAHVLAEHGLSRVSILDFDVHHGNGTEDVLTDEPRVLFCSTYQNPLFPYTSDTSIPGKLIKSPLTAGSDGDVFRQTIERDWLPALDAFRPEMIFVSAGFDAHRDDPLADIRLEVEDFTWVTERICEAAATYCDGRVVSVLEGGYSLSALADSSAAHVDALLKAGE